MKSLLFFSLIYLTLSLGNNLYAFFTVSLGGFQGYQAVIQKDDALTATTTLASLPTIGAQFQYQTTLNPRVGFRFKFETISVKFIAPPSGGFTMNEASFNTVNYTLEIPFQQTIHFQTLLKIARRQRILYNLDDLLNITLYKPTITDVGYGFNLDTQNLGGLVLGVGGTAALLYYNSTELDGSKEAHLGADIEVRAKLGWIYEVGWGNILRVSYSNFFMPTKNCTNNGKEIRFFGEIFLTF